MGSGNESSRASGSEDSRGSGRECSRGWVGRGNTVDIVENSSQMDRDQCVRDMCAAARRIIGFKPIEPRMLELQMRCYGAKTKEEAMLMEIKSYLKCEMKVRPSVIEELDIVRVFHPAKEDWNVLYV